MIIDTNSANNIEVIGDDILEFKTGIDPKNLDFITTLLSSNLYSHPERSFIRETVSNAWDSHVEAGTTDKPVLLIMNFDEKSITIRDYGVGISPERFKDIYCNIGSSTKRESNDYIGGFGIGRFSALACSPVVHITSYYKGKSFYYIMSKDGNKIVTNLINVQDTDQPDGVAVNIRNIESPNNYIDALQYIVFFDNIYIEKIGFSGYYRHNLHELINTSKILTYKNYSFINLQLPSDNAILLGNVLYELDKKIIDKDLKHFVDRVTNGTGIAFRFQVGELMTTPNREQLIYTEESIKLINQRIRAAKDEFIKNFLNFENSIDISLETFITLFDTYIDYSPFDKKHNEHIRVSIEQILFDKNDISCFTYKGQHITKNEFNTLSQFLRYTPYNCTGYINNKKISKSYDKYDLYKRKKLILKGSITNSLFNSWLRLTYNEYIIISELATHTELKNYAKSQCWFFTDKCDETSQEKVLDFALDILNHNVITVDSKTDSRFLEYAKNSVKSKTVKSTKVILKRFVRGPSSYSSATYPNIDKAILSLKNTKKGIFVATKDMHKEWYPLLCEYYDYDYIICSKELYNKIRTSNLTNLLTEEKLLSRKSLRQLKSINKCSALETRFLDVLPVTEESKLLIKLCQDRSRYLTQRIVNTLKDVDKWKDIQSDPYVDAIVLKYYDIYVKVKKFLHKNKINEFQPFSNLLVRAILIKYKVCRLSYNAYKETLNNNLIHLLWSKF